MKETNVSTLERLIAAAANVSVLITFIFTMVKEIIAWWPF